jgi:hypothetical protein
MFIWYASVWHQPSSGLSPAPVSRARETMVWDGKMAGMPDAVSPVDLASLAAAGGHPGARWRLDGQDLQANLVRLDRGDRIQRTATTSSRCWWSLSVAGAS